MMNPRDAFTPGDIQAIPPSVPVRHWHSAIPLGFGSAVASFVGIDSLLWRSLPLLGEAPSGSFGSHLLAWGETLLYGASDGNVAGDAVHVYLARLADIAASDSKIGWEVWSRFGLCTLAAIYFGFKILLWAARPRSAEEHVSGAQLHTGGDAVQEALAKAKRLRGGSKNGFLKLHPALDLPKTQWGEGGMLVVGSPGSGKSQIIAPILQQIIKAKHRAIIFDAKGEFRAAFKKPILLSPFDARSAVWNISGDLLTRADAEVFAASLIPESEKNRYFSESAQMLLTGIVWSLQTDCARKWGWKELLARAALPAIQLEELLRIHYPEAASLLNPQSRSAGDVHSTLIAATRLLRSLAAAWGEKTEADGKPRREVSLRTWMRDDYRGSARQLILGNGPNPQLTRAYVSAMLNVLVPHLVSPELPDSPDRTLAFVLDELPALGKINLPPLLDRGRSKGVICIMGIQDIAQVKMIYGPEMSATIQSMASIQVICRIGPGEMRDAIASRFGNRRVAVHASTSDGHGTSRRQVEHDRPVILPSDLTQDLGKRETKKGFAIRALVSLGGDILRLDFPGTKLAKLRRAFVPAAWLAPVQAASKSEPAATAASLPPPPPKSGSGDGQSLATPGRAELLRLANRLEAARRAPTSNNRAHDPAA